MISIGFRHVCTIQRRYVKQKASYTGGAGTPAVDQTVVGADTSVTGRVDSVATGYLVLRDLSGDLEVGEVISTTTWSGTLSSIADHKNSAKEPIHYFEDDQIGLACKVYFPSGKGYSRTDAGERADAPLKCAMPSEAVFDEDVVYRIKIHGCEFAGVYDITNPKPLGGLVALDHYEMVLRRAR
jgi:hypothetical protein